MAAMHSHGTVTAASSQELVLSRGYLLRLLIFERTLLPGQHLATAAMPRGGARRCRLHARKNPKKVKTTAHAHHANMGKRKVKLRWKLHCRFVGVVSNQGSALKQATLVHPSRITALH